MSADKSSPSADDVDVAVIGSGFGGAVTAWRLRERFPASRIVLLERGAPYPPGSFPRTPNAMRRNFWDPNSYLYGLFELWAFAHCGALVSSGLGGGSLIYANVMLEKPEETFAASHEVRWPVGAGELAPHYARVRDEIDAGPLPQEYVKAPPGSPTSVPKARAFIDAAAAAGLGEPRLADIAISFRDEQGVARPGAPIAGENLHGRERRTCTLTGECDIGCNEGAKNTLDFTYLTWFAGAGGEIRTCCEATSLQRERSGTYLVRYCQHLQAREQVQERGAAGAELLDQSTGALRSLRARVVVLAAGTFGSTRLLLRSRPGLPRLGAALGSRFSTNGDMLSRARGCTETASGRPRQFEPSRGPVITAVAKARRGSDALWMEDAGAPVLADWAWQLGELPRDAFGLFAGLLRMRRNGGTRGRAGGVASLAFGSASESSSALPMLTMGIGDVAGRISLDGDGLSLDWDPRGSRPYFDWAEGQAALVAAALGGELGERSVLRRARGLTVHPLGGCPMGASAEEAVVGPGGEVFGYPGLFVADGSVMPGPVGPNPSMTIAAMASHIAGAAGDALERAGG